MDLAAGDSEAEFCTVTHHCTGGSSEFFQKTERFYSECNGMLCFGMVVGLGDCGMTSESEKDDIRWDEGERREGGREGERKEEEGGGVTNSFIHDSLKIF